MIPRLRTSVALPARAAGRGGGSRTGPCRLAGSQAVRPPAVAPKLPVTFSRAINNKPYTLLSRAGRARLRGWQRPGDTGTELRLT